MPRTRSLAWSELKIGVLAVGAVVITVVTIFMLTGSRGFFWQRYRLKTRFTNVAGLKPGSPVRLAGVEVGTVSDVVLVGDQVDVSMEVNKIFQERITSASIAKLGSVSLLGESAVDISPAGQGTPVPEWGYVPTGRPAAGLSDITESAGRGIEDLTGLIRDLRDGKGTAGKLLSDDQLYAELRRFVAAAGDLTEGLKQGKGSLGRLLSDRTTADALEKSLKNIEEVTRRLGSGEGSIGRLLKDDAFSSSLTSATKNLDTLVGRLNSGQGTAGKLMTDTAMFDRLTSLSGRLDDLVARLNGGEGSAGQLLKDKRLYENMNGVVADARLLIAEIRKDPKKYLNVKVSIF
jgi:phospholipid/cholesterol/gamma-HCH transport system substrate-binding protein